MTKTPPKVGVVGAGAFGTALALAATRAGAEVRLWARRASLVDKINFTHENPDYLQGIPLPPTLRATADLQTLEACEVIFVVVPTQSLREVCTALKTVVAPGTPLILCAKGIEQTTLEFPLEIAAKVAPGSPLAILSGPGFARDIALGHPVALTLAAAEETLAQHLAQLIGQTTFRPYISTDPLGAEIGGAVKNVLAIACGIAEGLGLGESAKAALITRGFAEMARFGRALGAKLETLTGLSGLGDLVLTCTSKQSRNLSLGLAIGGGQTADEALAANKDVVEGAATAPALVTLAVRHGVDMPIAQAVHAILQNQLDANAALETLLSRPFSAEGAGL